MSLRHTDERPVAALIVFADIIDSSKYSAVLGYREYASRLLDFQDTFKDLGRRYFPQPDDRVEEYCSVEARGDEGAVFLVCRSGVTRGEQADHVLRAIEFLYHLKGRLKFGCDPDVPDAAPYRFDVGAGIHWGQVMLTLKEENHHSVIDGIEGFAINFAKRVESSSRGGRHSRILLSPEAAHCLELEPAILASVHGAMKGIHDDMELYEVEAGLFDRIELRHDDEADERLVQAAERLCANPMTIDVSWVKSLAVSVLEHLVRSSPIQADKAKYRQLQYDLAWHSTKEVDPILLFLRSRHCRESRQHTREMRYLQNVLSVHPEFVHARLMLVNACWAVARESPEHKEKLFARDTAKEFLEHYGTFLKKEEKKAFTKLIANCGAPVAPRARTTPRVKKPKRV